MLPFDVDRPALREAVDATLNELNVVKNGARPLAITNCAHGGAYVMFTVAAAYQLNRAASSEPSA